MQTADSTTNPTLLSYFPERIQAALRAYGAEVSLPPESVVQFAIGYFLEAADIKVSPNGQEIPNSLPTQGVLAHLPNSLQNGIEQYATKYEFPADYVVELAVTFILDPDASGFEDCQVGVQREQVHLLQQYRENSLAQAA